VFKSLLVFQLEVWTHRIAEQFAKFVQTENITSLLADLCTYLGLSESLSEILIQK